VLPSTLRFSPLPTAHPPGFLETTSRWDYQNVNPSLDLGAVWLAGREGELPHRTCFDQQDYCTLGYIEGSFFQTIGLSHPYEGFCTWLWDHHYRSLDVFGFRSVYVRRGQRAESSAGVVAPFDGEILGGCVDHSSLVGPTRHLMGPTMTRLGLMSGPLVRVCLRRRPRTNE
jgi:hypothetical protein